MLQVLFFTCLPCPCPHGAGITRSSAPGALAAGPTCSWTARAWGCANQHPKQLCTSACTHTGTPEGSPGPPHKHRDAHVHTTSRLGDLCLAAPHTNLHTAASPSRSWGRGQSAGTQDTGHLRVPAVPRGWALRTTKTHRLQNVTRLTGSKTETFVSKAAGAGTWGTRTAHVSQPVQQLPRPGCLETHSDGSLSAI